MRTPFGWTLTLLAIAWLVGMIAGWISRGHRETRLRLHHKPKKSALPVLVPPGPAPRLIPSDSPKAARASRLRPAGGPRYGAIDYLAAFSDSPERGRVDYLLVSSDSVEESVDAPEERDGSLHHTG